MKPAKYTSLLKEIRQLVEQARHNVIRQINTELLITYWHVGRLIVEYEQTGNVRAEYGKQLLVDLSKSLTVELGKGFSRSNLQNMRLFYQRFSMSDVSIRQTVSGKLPKQKRQTLSGKSKGVQTLPEQTKISLTVSGELSWSHHCELLKCSNEIEMGFYQHTAINENWSVRELQRQIDTALFERIALSKDAKGVMKLATKGQVIEKETDIPKTLMCWNS